MGKEKAVLHYGSERQKNTARDSICTDKPAYALSFCESPSVNVYYKKLN